MQLQKRDDDFVSLRQAMNRLFDESFWAPFETTSSALSVSFPEINVSETDKEIKVSANIPGIDPKDVEIEADEDSLTISGEIEKEEEEEGEEVYRYERRFGKFHRSIPLPIKIDSSKVKAEAENGVINITLPKVKDDKKKKVKIKVN